MIALSLAEVAVGIALTVVTAGVGATIGTGLIGVGLGSLGSAISNEKNGGSFLAGWAGAQAGGIISLVPGLGPAIGAFSNSVIVDAIDKGKIDWLKAGLSAFTGFVFGYVSYTINIASSNDILVKLTTATVSGLVSLVETIIEHFGF